MTAYDAIVVGAGQNGLVAANKLADHGWDVLVLEEQDEVGGAVRSDEGVRAGFVHDTFSAFYPFAAASPNIQGFDLERHGLTWCHAPAVLGHPRKGLPWALQHRDREVTARSFDDQHAGDGAAWLRLCEKWDAIGDSLVGALLSPFPPVRHGLGALSSLPRVGGLDFVRTMLTPAASFGRAEFGGDAPRLLLAGNAGHADIPLDAPGSGLMGLLMTMLGQTVGFPVPRGGAGELTRALARRFESLGGTIRCSSPVERLEVSGGRVVAVRTRGADRFEARRAVVAAVVAPKLYGDLLAEHDVPRRARIGMRSFELDPSTLKVDWALDGPVPWETEPEHTPGTFHVADSVEDMSEAFSQVANAAVPAKPFLLAGQMSTTDPTRSPPGTESMWAYTHVPQRSRRDAGGDGLTGAWDDSECQRFADRVQARIEHLAPGFSARVTDRRVLGPHQLQQRNTNLIGGAVNGGTAQIHQELVFRPFPGLGRAETGVRGLYLGSASAHPGGGVHGAPGMNAARAALAHHRLRLGRSPRRG